MDDYMITDTTIGCSISYDDRPAVLVPIPCDDFPQEFKDAMQ